MATLIDLYEVREIIGAGSCATVRKVVRKSDGQVGPILPSHRTTVEPFYVSWDSRIE